MKDAQAVGCWKKSKHGRQFVHLCMAKQYLWLCTQTTPQPTKPGFTLTLSRPAACPVLSLSSPHSCVLIGHAYYLVLVYSIHLCCTFDCGVCVHSLFSPL